MFVYPTKNAVVVFACVLMAPFFLNSPVIMIAVVVVSNAQMVKHATVEVALVRTELPIFPQVQPIVVHVETSAAPTKCACLVFASAVMIRLLYLFSPRVPKTVVLVVTDAAQIRNVLVGLVSAWTDHPCRAYSLAHPIAEYVVHNVFRIKSVPMVLASATTGTPCPPFKQTQPTVAHVGKNVMLIKSALVDLVSARI